VNNLSAIRLLLKTAPGKVSKAFAFRPIKGLPGRGLLVFFVGGDKEDVEALKPYSVNIRKRGKDNGKRAGDSWRNCYRRLKRWFVQL
jgi:hypothetical protein